MISKFTSAPDDINMMFRQIRDCIEIGVYPMLYGYRVRAGIVGDNCCHLDYCAGPDQKEVENVYSLVISIVNKKLDELESEQTEISLREKAYLVFKDFPEQKRKPMINDFECFMKLSELCGSEIISVKLPNLASRKVRFILQTNPSAFETVVQLGGFDDLI